MVGILLIYFIGKEFYNLAGRYAKSQWGFAILGILTYYVGTFLGGILIGIFALFAEIDIEHTSNTGLSLIALPVGLLTCWGLYKLLEFQWSKKPDPVGNEDVLDAHIMDD